MYSLSSVSVMRMKKKEACGQGHMMETKMTTAGRKIQSYNLPLDSKIEMCSVLDYNI